MPSIFDHVAAGGDPADHPDALAPLTIRGAAQPTGFDPEGTGPANYDPSAAPLLGDAPAAARTLGTSLASGHSADDLMDYLSGHLPQTSSKPLAYGMAAATMPVVMGAHAVDAVTDAARWAGDVQAGRYGTDVTDPASHAAIVPGAVNAAMTLGTGGLPMAEEGAAGIFGGRMSRTADQFAADQAEQMLGRGADAETVRQATGWFRGNDGRMRTEIPDSAASFKPGAVDAYMAGPQMLPDVIDHPDLFAAYPGLKNMVVTGQPMPGSDPTKIAGAFYSNKYQEPKRLAVTYMAPEEDHAEALRTLLHETQHAVQAIEDFAPGASPSGFKGRLPPIAAVRDTKLMSALLNSGVSPAEASDVFAQRMGRDPHKAALSLAQTFTPEEVAKLPLGPQDAYMRSRGEVEARNVEARSAMTPSELADTPPWVTQSVPDAMQLQGTGGVSREFDDPAVMARHQDIRAAVDRALRSGWKPQFDGTGYLKGLPPDLVHYPTSNYLIRDRLLQHGIADPGVPNYSLYGAGSLAPIPVRSAIDGSTLYARGAPGGALAAGALEAAERQPLTLYHGSPHRFDAFDLSKVGSTNFGHGAYLTDAEDSAKWYRDAAATPGNPGHMYEVGMSADPARFMDWTRPISAQSHAVQQALAAHEHHLQWFNDEGHNPEPMDVLGDHTPEQLVSAMNMRRMFEPAEDANFETLETDAPRLTAEALRDSGIAGVRYSNAGSPGAGPGSSNYVVFDPASHTAINRVYARGLPGGNALMPGAPAPAPANALAPTPAEPLPPDFLRLLTAGRAT